MCKEELPEDKGFQIRSRHKASDLVLVGSQLKELAQGFFTGAAIDSGVSLSVTGQKNLRCHSEEEAIYEWNGAPQDAPPLRTITAHAQNAIDFSDCAVEFRFSARTEEGTQVIETDRVSAGGSTPSRTGRWVRVTATCLESEGDAAWCRISWTIGP